MHPTSAGDLFHPWWYTCFNAILSDEWIRNLWYIYTMEYYSAIKKNSFESVLMIWMKLEPIIQSEVNQKDKDQYMILTYRGPALAGSRGYPQDERHQRERDVWPALIGASLRGRERESEREREWPDGGVQQGCAESGNALYFTMAFIP